MPIDFIAKATTFLTGSATSLVIPVPAGVQADDLLLASLSVKDGTIGAITEPAGWTALFENGNDAAGNGLWYRVAGGSEPANYTFSWVTSRGNRYGAMFAYRNVPTATPVDVSAQGTVTANPYDAPSVTTTVASALVVAIASQIEYLTALAFGTPTGHTLREESKTDTSGAIGYTLADKIFPSSGATGVATFPDVASADARLYRVALKPASTQGQSKLIMVSV